MATKMSALSASTLASLSWKQRVADQIIDIVNGRSSTAFSIDDLYARLAIFNAAFPNNRNPREKIRQSLQKLRNDGFLVFKGDGNYTFNLTSQEVVSDPVSVDSIGVEVPSTRQVVRNVRLRNTLLAWEIKRRYGNVCQVCRLPVLIGQGLNYAEAHHLHPLGSPHFGPDVVGNIIVLCPNHHVMFDYGALTIDPASLNIRHIVRDSRLEQSTLYVAPWHRIQQRYLQYHNTLTPLTQTA